MTRFLTLAALAIVTLVAAVSGQQTDRSRQPAPPIPRPAAGSSPSASPAPAAAPSSTALAQRYCVTCHSDRARTGGLTLEGLDPDHADAHAEVWEKAIKKLRAGMMPPAGAPRPARAELDAFRHGLESSIDGASAARPNPGTTSLHRL